VNLLSGMQIELIPVVSERTYFNFILIHFFWNATDAFIKETLIKFQRAGWRNFLLNLFLFLHLGYSPFRREICDLLRILEYTWKLFF
jgi:hypothetical protein